MDIREAIRQQLRVIPDAVKTGSVQTAVRWKERARLAEIVVKNPRSTEQQLQEALLNLTRGL
jgi:hypothetical protein